MIPHCYHNLLLMRWLRWSVDEPGDAVWYLLHDYHYFSQQCRAVRAVVLWVIFKLSPSYLLMCKHKTFKHHRPFGNFNPYNQFLFLLLVSNCNQCSEVSNCHLSSYRESKVTDQSMLYTFLSIVWDREDWCRC